MQHLVAERPDLLQALLSWTCNDVDAGTSGEQ